MPTSELPALLSSGDQTQTVNCPGTTATIPPVSYTHLTLPTSDLV